MDWNEVFKLPADALAGNRRVPKKTLVAEGGFTRRELKILDKVARVDLFATVTKTTARILPRVDAEFDIQSVIFLRCVLARGVAAFGEVTELLHRVFPNPTVILVEVGEDFGISAALTRKSRAEKGKVVIEGLTRTPLFDPEIGAVKPFLAALDFGKLSQNDLLAYLKDIVWNIELSRGIPLVGFFPTCGDSSREEIRALLTSADTLSGELQVVASRQRDRNLTLNEQFQLRAREIRLKQERDMVAGTIKEMCGG